MVVNYVVAIMAQTYALLNLFQDGVPSMFFPNQLNNAIFFVFLVNMVPN